MHSYGTPNFSSARPRPLSATQLDRERSLQSYTVRGGKSVDSVAGSAAVSPAPERPGRPRSRGSECLTSARAV